jgi:ADP-dependent NAD(P)H-hydrate dehydratase
MNRTRRGPGARLISPALLARWPLPEANPKLGKVGRGSVLAVGGSVQNPGAIMLAAVAALRAGAGRVQIATARHVAGPVATAVPEARVLSLPSTRSGELSRGASRILRREIEACQTLLVGPGMTDPGAAADLLLHCVRRSEDSTLVVDAAALKAFHGHPAIGQSYGGSVVATPHAGEMANLWKCDRDRILSAPLEVARQAASTFGIVIVLKGAKTYIVAPDGTAFVNTAGNVGLGTSGSGDVLSGVIAGLAARGADAVQAAVWGVYAHAMAGDALASSVGALGFLAREIVAEIPRALAKPRRR